MITPGKARIELRLRELAQLFNSMDPSPFIDRDLDADAEEFIVSWAREHPVGHEIELVIHLATVPPPDRAAGTGDAVRHYFNSRAEIRRREFRRLMRQGRFSLGVGLLSSAKSWRSAGSGTTAEIVRESLLIGGWVAMWRPLGIYLYDWWPLRYERRLLERLSRMNVRLVLPPTGNP
ncbi:MAG: hypothetical protein EXS43_05955 [Opitutus sp.]|nr:hypothetical protein [Opitutus sp.]